MIPTVNLSALSTGGKAALGLGAALALVLALGLAVWRGYAWGHGVAETRGRAELAEYQATVAQAGRLASDTARKILDAEIVRRDGLERDMAVALTTIAAQRREITKRRIAHAAQDVALVDGVVVFGPDFVRLLREAFGYRDGGLALPPAPGGTAADAGPAPAPGAGLVRGGMTAADLGAFARAFGLYAEELRVRLAGLIAWAEGLPRGQATAGEP